MMRNLRIQSPAAANLLCVPESNVASTLRIGGLRKTNFSYRNHALVELITKFGEHGHIGKIFYFVHCEDLQASQIQGARAMRLRDTEGSALRADRSHVAQTNEVMLCVP
jgi:hypothetical protein